MVSRIWQKRQGQEVIQVEKKKMGRPTDSPKIIVKRARMSESDVKKLKECCKILEMSESDILRKGVDEVYQKLRN